MTMSVDLERAFEAKLREALLADVERQVRKDVGPALKETAEANWKAYAARNDYDISHVWDDAELSVSRRRNAVAVRIEWPALTALFEFGVSPHTIDGNPLLHFYWEAKDQWITTESVDWGSETGGIEAARAIRDALDLTERDLAT